MPEIRQLPPGVVNKIAAGEVIERPASVVKELVENSLDAGAKRIDVTVGQGGLDLVRVTDDGCGMSPEQLPLALASHATSKIRDADDLFRVGTLGFRGEALASIAEVSRFHIRSRAQGSPGGAELSVDGGAHSEVAPVGCPVGTSIEIRDLFYNTPVRRKFLRSTQTEMGHVTEAITRLALAWPEVHFTLRHNDRTLHDLPPTSDVRERIAAFFGPEIADGLLPVDSYDEEIRLHGYVADPAHSRGNNRLQYFFLNGRCIRDRALQHALGEAYRGLLLTGRFPIAFLRFQMPPDAVDVNVHPTKLEVRFQDSGRLYSQLLGSLRKKFLATDLVAKVQSGAGVGAPAASAWSSPDPNGPLAEHRRELIEWATGARREASAGEGARLRIDEAEAESLRGQASLDLRFEPRATGPLTLNRFDPARFESARFESAHAGPTGVASPEDSRPANGGEFLAPVSRPIGPPRESRGMQIQKRYLVTETSEGMEVIDQHALHERILYEQLRSRMTDGTLETQRLLVPETVPLRPAEHAAAVEARESLAKLGILIEPFGGDTVLVSGHPAILSDCDPAEIVRMAVARLTEGDRRVQISDLTDELLHMVSCKAAVKAGDYLTPEEIDALLEQRHLFENTHHCPHGRPTSLLFTREELDKRFKRT